MRIKGEFFMKKYIVFLLCIVMTLPLFACRQTAVPDDYTPPRAPEPVCEEARRVEITVGTPALFEAMLGTGVLGMENYSVGAHVSPETDEMRVFTSSGDRVLSEISLSPDGSFIKYAANDGEVKTEDLYMGFFRELLVSESLGYMGKLQVGYKYNDEFLKKLGKYGTLEWEENYAEHTRIATLSFTGEQMAAMLESEVDGSQLALVIGGFYAGESTVNVARDKLIEYLRKDTRFAFTEKLTLHASSGRVLLADVTAKSESVIFSLVYDGSTADITAGVRHRDDLKADFSSKHEDGKTTYILSCIDGSDTKGARLILADGSIYAEWTTGEKGIVGASIKYDKTRGELEACRGEHTLVLRVVDNTLTGTYRKGERTREITLTFAVAEETNDGTRYQLIKTGDIDVSAAEVYLSVSKVNE